MHRKAGDYRDVPAPSWLWEMVRDTPLTPGNGRLFQQYGTIYFRFVHAAKAIGIADGFSPHSLRHTFASAMLACGVQITALAHFLGYRDINVTHQVYGHLLPSTAKRGRRSGFAMSTLRPPLCLILSCRRTAHAGAGKALGRVRHPRMGPVDRG
jgi:integrase